MKYTLAVRLEDPPRPTCVACCRAIAGIHTVITKEPDGLTGVVCGLCMAELLGRPVHFREIEFAITMQKTVPELAAWFISRGIFEIPTDHESVCRALGTGVGFARNIWESPL